MPDQAPQPIAAPAAKAPVLEIWSDGQHRRLVEQPLKTSSQRIRGIRPLLAAYRAALFGAKWVALLSGLRRLTRGSLRGILFVLIVALAGFAIASKSLLLIVASAVLLTIAVLEARAAASSRVVIGAFSGLDSSESLRSSRLAELLRVELARLSDLFQTVGDRRAVSSGAGPKRTLDATLSVDTVASALQAAVSAESKVSIGPLAFPARLVVAIGDRIVSPPRISGALHVDASSLIVTAQVDGLDGLSWRVPPQGYKDDAADGERGTDAQLDSVSAALRELALRIFTDLALGRSVRWEASEQFVRGLDHVRACLRAPVDRKVNLRHAEREFLSTLSQDEDFPEAYYNLGVVYNELFTLAWSAGRTVEARNHLRAAQISFERAVERHPHRWENYFALAKTHFQNKRFADVLALCDRMHEMNPGLVARAKQHELRASALLATGGSASIEAASKAAREAVKCSLKAVLRSRLLPGFYSVEEELPAACLQTLGMVEACYAGADTTGTWGRVQAIYEHARSLAYQDGELRLELGLLALGAEKHDLAVEELAGAVRADPARPLYLAAHAAALAARCAIGPTQDDVVQTTAAVRELSTRAAQGLMHAYSPSRDGEACDLIRLAADRLGHTDLSAMAGELCAARDTANARLACPSPAAAGDPTEAPRDPAERVKRERARDTSSTVSAAFLQVVGQHESVADILDDYGLAVRRAQALLDTIRAARTTAGSAEQVAADVQREALETAERATSLNPLSVTAWMTLGDIHQEFADFGNARRAWVNALTQDPDNAALYDRMGSALWHLAFQGRSRPSDSVLGEARKHLRKALLLYETGELDEQIRTRYRLGKLYAALRDFDGSIAELRIVEAAGYTPIVGWVQLGLAYLQRGEYAESEYHFGSVIECGALLDSGRRPTRPRGRIDPHCHTNRQPGFIVGNPIDERQWPLGLVRGWGYLGMALSHTQRDGDLAMAGDLIRSARKTASPRHLDRRQFPTRIDAACDECEGNILLKQGAYDEATILLESAVSRHPYSRSYLNLARAYVRLGRESPAEQATYAEQARRCLQNADRLGSRAAPAEIDEVGAEIEALVAPAGAVPERRFASSGGGAAP